MNFAEKLDKLNKLSPSTDWVSIKLEALLEPINQKIDAAPEGEGFFSFVKPLEKILTEEEFIRREKIISLMLKRYEQIEKKRKQIIDSLSLDEQEQLIIS